uniref:proton-translocating NAD(P)(+) transhydrogenase n=2 Tax=Desulfovibrio desulfuricans TaxID=876 RepID=B8J2Z4_DESDA
MNAITYNIIAGILVAAVLFGLRLMNKVPTAVRGNLFCASAMGLAILVTMFKDGSLASPALWLAIAVGMTLGLTLSNKVKMIQMPQMVAFLHGIGGGAAAIVSFLVLTDTGAPSAFERGSACLALAMGMTTIAGSFVAAGKLHQILPQKPVILPDHTKIIMAILAVMGFSVLMGTAFPQFLFGFFIFLMFVTGTAFGIGFTLRVGGADMPITISLLNSMGGVCAAIAGFAVNDPLLVAIGGIIGSSGYLLTRIMCRAMNRKLLSILLGESSVVTPSAPAKKAAPAARAAAPARSVESEAAKLVQNARNVVIVPGYGMALAQAQYKVKQLADLLESRGAKVSYGIHPVAGRMPGHMNVLLAEANVDYEHLLEMDTVNPMFAESDLVIVVGANDVVNPAANTAEGTPIYGMPILKADEAKNIIIANYDDKPGYAGVPNPLYGRDGVILMTGDAGKTFDRLLAYAQGNGPADEAAPAAGADSREAEAAKLVQNARNVVIVPGYGMALAQAQHKVKLLADALESRGVKVSYGIHPVAGRMPGHMNVLLAEANVDYENLLEMDTVNPMFAESDLVVIIGANDVVNPAANTAEGTPIYGMPILKADECRNIIVCNYDDKPGYAGVPNPLYERDGVILMTGDAAKTVDRLVSFAQGESPAAPAAGTDSREADAAKLVQNARNVVIVPGYGMALAQAQYKVKQLADLLESRGARVSYGIHPVAGRMPGHMNVLLAEANVDYEHLLEMDTVNPMFAESDLVIVVGANDVVNPAANSAEGTPIYGMPILKADEAKNIIIANYDDKPGYAGVPNPLYEREGVILMTGDAGKTFDRLLAYAQGGQA